MPPLLLDIPALPIGLQSQSGPDIPTRSLHMEEVAVATPGTLARLVLPATRLLEVRDGGELGVDGLLVEPAVVEGLHTL